MDKNIEEILKQPTTFFLILASILIVSIGVLSLLLRKISKGTEPFEQGKWGFTDIAVSFFTFCFFLFFFKIIHTITLGEKILEKETEIFVLLIMSVFVQFLTSAFILYFLKKTKKYSTKPLGFTKLSKQKFFCALGSYFAFIPAYYFIVVISYVIILSMGKEPQKQNIVAYFMQAEGIRLWISVFCASMLVPIFEEFFFRAFLYTWLRSLLGAPLAVIVSGLIFSAVHGTLFGFLPIAALGMLLAILYEKTQCIWVSIFVHALHNFLTIMLVLQGFQ